MKLFTLPHVCHQCLCVQGASCMFRVGVFCQVMSTDMLVVMIYHVASLILVFRSFLMSYYEPLEWKSHTSNHDYVFVKHSRWKKVCPVIGFTWPPYFRLCFSSYSLNWLFFLICQLLVDYCSEIECIIAL